MAFAGRADLCSFGAGEGGVGRAKGGSFAFFVLGRYPAVLRVLRNHKSSPERGFHPEGVNLIVLGDSPAEIQAPGLLKVAA